MKAAFRVILLCGCLVALASTVTATKITLTATSVPNWRYTASGTVYLHISVDRAFTEDVGLITIQPGPGAAGWYKRIPCTVTSAVQGSGEVIVSVNIPSIILDSTIDGIDVTTARYSAAFYTSAGQRLGPYAGFESFRVPDTFAGGTTGSWSDIRTFNFGPVMPDPFTTDYYTRAEVNRLIAAGGGGGGGGLSTLNGLAGATQTFVNDTNVTMVSAGTTHTLTWAGQLALTRGGTGAATASGARASLGAAASGANSDITSITGLTTALAATQGGTGFGSSAPYTIGSILYPSTTTVLAQLTPGTTGQFLSSQGAGLPPVWATATGVLSGGTAGRITLWSGAASVTSDSNLLFDTATDRLSVGTTDTTEIINLPNASFIGGRGTVAAAQVKMLGVSAGTRVISSTGAGVSISDTTTAVDTIKLGDDTTFIHTYTQSGATTVNPLRPQYEVATNGLRVYNGISGSYNESTNSNNYHFASIVKNIGTSPVVAVYGQGIAAGASANTFGGNFTGFAIANNAGATALEVGYGVIGGSLTGASADGLIVTVNGDLAANGPFIQIQSNASTAKGTHVLNVNAAAFQPLSTGGAIINVNGALATTYGLNFAAASFTGAAILLPAGNFNGLRSNNLANSANYNLARIGVADFAEFGDDGIVGAVFYGGKPREAMRLQNDRVTINAATSPTHALQVRSRVVRALTGTVAITNGSATVTGTGTNFSGSDAQLMAGSSFKVTGDATIYLVRSVASDTSLTLSANYGGSTNPTATATTDDPLAVIQSEGATNNFVEVSQAGNLKVMGDGVFGDELGALQITSPFDTNLKLYFGVNATSNYSFISSLKSGTGWNNLILQGGGGATNAKVGVGTSAPLSMLHVDGNGAKTADYVVLTVSNQATSSSAFSKVGANFNTTGAWVGPNYGFRVDATGGADTSGNRTNYPAALRGGETLIGPTTQSVPGGMLAVYGQPSRAIAGTAADAITVSVVNGSPTVIGVGTTFTNYASGDSLQFGTDSAAYQIATVDSATQITLSANYGGTTATLSQAWADPLLLLATNGAGTERLRLSSGGDLTLTNATLLKKRGSPIASAATITLTNNPGNVFHITGTTTITTINGGRDGQVIHLILDSSVTLTDGSNLVLSGSFTSTGTNDTITLVYDSNTAVWYELTRSGDN